MRTFKNMKKQAGATSAEALLLCALILPCAFVTLPKISGEIRSPLSLVADEIGGGSSSSMNGDDSTQNDNLALDCRNQFGQGQTLNPRCPRSNG